MEIVSTFPSQFCEYHLGRGCVKWMLVPTPARNEGTMLFFLIIWLQLELDGDMLQKFGLSSCSFPFFLDLVQNSKICSGLSSSLSHLFDALFVTNHMVP